MTKKSAWMLETGRRHLGLCPDSESHRMFDQLKGTRKSTETFASMVRLVAEMVRLGRAGWSFQAVGPDGTIIEFDLGDVTNGETEAEAADADSVSA